MTRTLLIIFAFALFAGLGVTSHLHADVAAAADAPASTEHAPAAPKADPAPTYEQVQVERMPPRRPAAREDQPLSPAGDRPMPPPPPLTPDQQQKALEVLRLINPDLADKIAEAQKSSPDRAANILRRFGPKLLELAELKNTDPNLYQLRVADQRYNFETFRLIRQLRDARDDGDTAKADRLTARLRELLNRHFDIRVKLREHELAALEKRIIDIRAELKDHHDRKQQILDEQILQMTSDTSPASPATDKPQPQ